VVTPGTLRSVVAVTVPSGVRVSALPPSTARSSSAENSGSSGVCTGTSFTPFDAGKLASPGDHGPSGMRTQSGSGSRWVSQDGGIAARPTAAATTPPTIAAVVSTSPPASTQVRIAAR
jgi:hypothetical protein